MTAAQRRYRATERGKAAYARAKRKSHLKTAFGISPEQYQSLLLKQSGRCALCRTGNNGNRSWHVDHCHVTGKVRGLLCMRCNTGIGMLGDNPERCEAAAKYLRDA